MNQDYHMQRGIHSLISSAKRKDGRRSEEEGAVTRAWVGRTCSERKGGSSCLEVEKKGAQVRDDSGSSQHFKAILCVCLRMPNFSK